MLRMQCRINSSNVKHSCPNVPLLHYVSIILLICVSIIFFQWHALDRSEQAKYYEMARKEKELHMQLYPGWSARDNYATHTKKKKRKREQQANEQKNAFGQGE